jgi:hypothetical protein
VCLVRHMLQEDTGPNSYDNLRTSLLSSRSLSNYQKMEKMMGLPPLGDRKLSVMLVEMLEYCPAGESATAVFAYLFLQRLPREIRVLLSEDDPADMRAIADKAYCLIAMHVPQGHDACAAVSPLDDSEGDLVAATDGARHKKKSWCPSSLSRCSSLALGSEVAPPAVVPTRLPCPAPPCASTTPNSESRPSNARRVACGRKTSVPGHDFGGTPRPPLLHHRQRFQLPLPGYTGLAFSIML